MSNIEFDVQLTKIDDYLAGEETGKAVELIYEILKSDEPRSDELIPSFFLAVAQSEDEELENLAIRVFEGMLEENDDTDITYYLSVLYTGKDKFEESNNLLLSLFETEESLEETQVGSELNLRYCIAMNYFSMKRYGDAKKIMEPVISELETLDQMYAPYYVFMGELEEQFSNIDLARKWYEQAIKVDPNDVEWYKKCALMLQAQKQYGQALSLWKKLLSISPKNIEAAITDQGRPIFQMDRFQKDINFAQKQMDICKANLN